VSDMQSIKVICNARNVVHKLESEATFSLNFVVSVSYRIISRYFV